MNSKETAEQLLGKEGLKALSISAEKNKGLYDFFKPRPEVLETFPTPEGVGEVEIHIEIPEFTCLCLHGDTMIDVVCNRSKHPHGVPIRDLVNTEGYVFSFDGEANKVCVKKYHSVRKTQSSVEVVKINMERFVHDQGLRYFEPCEIVLTPNHSVLIRTGFGKYVWKEVKDLEADDRFVANQRPSHQGCGRELSEVIFGEVDHRLIVEEIIGRKLTAQEVVHHIDGNHWNNNLSNLAVMLVNGHFSLHQKERYGYDRLDVDQLVLMYKSGMGLNKIAEYFECDIGTIRDRIKEKVQIRSQQDQIQLHYDTSERRQKMQKAVELYKEGYTAYELGDYFGCHSTSVLVWLRKAGCVIRNSAESQYTRKGVNLPSLNHRVVSIEAAGCCDVYNMEVEETRCFFANDVVVHNCPITGQPDWAKIIIDYGPNEKCVESKSLKIYKEGYRMYGTFHEACCQMFCTDLVNLLRPKWLRVKGEFTPRGGIPFNPSVEYYCEDDEILIKSSEAESGNSEVSEIPDEQSDSNKDAS